MTTGIVFGLIALIVIVYVIFIYNRMVTYRNRVRNGFAQIDVQLQRRYDLIPNLVETAKTYLQHERETLTGVIEARNQAESAKQQAAHRPDNAAAVEALSQAEGGLSAALGRLFALNESYPDLKADGTMRDLMEELSSTDNRVAFARQNFNDNVMFYNTYREQFPNNLISGPTGFQPAKPLELDNPAAAREPMRVSFA